MNDIAKIKLPFCPICKQGSRESSNIKVCKDCQESLSTTEPTIRLLKKYYLEKADGSAIDPNAKYFILRYDKDPHARKALDAYANSVLSENPKLAMDLQRALFETAKK